MRTATQYVESLRDGREVWYEGQRVPDVTRHPILGRCVKLAAREYALQNNPDHQDILTYLDPSGGKRVSRAYQIPRNADDLSKRRQMVEFLEFKAGGGVTDRFRESVASVLLGLLNCKHRFAETNQLYGENIGKFYDQSSLNDLLVTLAVVDPKGDRSKGPSQQHDPDLYLRVVDENSKGVIVRGAKNFGTAAPYADEIYVAPSGLFTEKDRDYIVAFAIPVDTKGVRIVCRPAHSASGEGAADSPLSHTWDEIDGFIIFDDVLIPWERVFLNRDWKLLEYYFKFSNWVWFAYSFVARTLAKAELLLGASYLMADYNGLADIPTVQQELAEFVVYVQTLKSHLRAAEMDFSVAASGIATPELRATSVARYFAAANYRRMVEISQNLTGAAMAVSPGEKDLSSEVLGPYITKYFAGRQGISGEQRLRLFKLLFDLTTSSFAGHKQLFEIFAQGSLQFQKTVLYGQHDLSQYAKKAEQVLDQEQSFYTDTG